MISSHIAAGSPGSSTFSFNLVPSYVKLPDGTEGLLVRSVNSSAGQCYGGTMQCDKQGTCNGGEHCSAHGASTALNPDYITFTRYRGGKLADPDDAALEPITDANIVLVPNRSAGSPEECGVQDPRIVFNKDTGLYVLAYTTFGFAEQSPNGPIPQYTCGGGGAGLGIATSKDPSDPNGWTRHGYDQLGKSAALLVRETGPHYAFFGIPAINMARSHDLVKWENITWNWMINDDDFSGFIEAGGPPVRMEDGNYLFSYNILGPCNCWGAGYAILDGDDPSVVIQRESGIIWPELPWETVNASNPGTAWEPMKCCIGATNSIQPLGGNEFLAHYVTGDSVSGGSILTVEPR